MSNILIVQGHPDGSAPHLCHALGQAYAAAAEGAGHTVEIIDLGQIEIALLRSKAEWESVEMPNFAADGQSAITHADHIVFIYPLWLGTMPALLKAWLEHVFREGFALKVTATGWESFLKGKSARVVVTMGMPAMAYRLIFFAHSLRSFERNILKFCGIKPVAWSIFGSIEDPSGMAQAKSIETMRLLGAKCA